MGETPIRGLGVPEHVSGAGAAQQASALGAPASGGPAFEALLEKLEQRAQELRSHSSSVEGPAELAGAVDRARASFEDALALSRGLLEAYRQSLQQRAAQ